jgi:hypothetical protein
MWVVMTHLCLKVPRACAFRGRLNIRGMRLSPRLSEYEGHKYNGRGRMVVECVAVKQAQPVVC